MANQSSYILYLSADEDVLSKIELHLSLFFYANKMCSPNCWLYDAESQGEMAPQFSPIQVKKWPGKLLFDISKPIYCDISFLYTLLSSSASI